MHNRNIYILSSLFMLLFLGGCATTTISDSQIEDKNAQIANLTKALENERREKQGLLKAIVDRDREIENLNAALGKKKRRPAAPKSKGYYFFVIRIQTALKNAGFSLGLIDGKMGQRTHAAIREFQKANGLPVNGRVDKQTWNLLRKHL